MMQFCQPFFCEGVKTYAQKEVSAPFHLFFYEFTIQSVINREQNALFMKCIPAGCITVLFIKSAGACKVELVGTPLAAKSLIVYPDALYFGVRLEPGMSFPYSRISDARLSTRDLTDTELFLPQLSDDMEDLCARLFEAESFTQRIHRLCAYLSHFSRDDLMEKDTLVDMLARIYRAKGNVEISGMADTVCYSERQFSRIFSESLGYSPKTFARIVRFQYVLLKMLYLEGQSRAAEGSRISALLDNLNYSDQAHFQREFKEFTTLTPRQFLQFARQNGSSEKCRSCTGHCGMCHE